MPADTLQNMALRQLSHRSRDIHDFGVVPVHLIKTVIHKITNPDQLRLLEQRSPQIVGSTRDVWLNMVKRDIPLWEKRLPPDYESSLFSPDKAAKWHRVYFKLKRDVEAEKERSRAMLVQGLKQSAAQRGPETAVRSREPLYLSDKKRARKSFADAKFTMNSGMYSKASKGESFFDKVKRNAVTKAASKRVAPTRTLKPTVLREIKRAPLSMVEDIKESRDAVVKNVGLPPNNNRATNPATTTTGATSSRQRAGRAPADDSAGVTKLTAEFLEDDYDDHDHDHDHDHDEDVAMSSDHSGHDDDDDELFGISKPTSKLPTPHHHHTSASPVKTALQPQMRTASPLPAQTAQTAQTAPRGLAATQKPMVLKRNKPARSIFAKK